MDQGIPVDVIYLDFHKAFDKVSHTKLSLKDADDEIFTSFSHRSFGVE